MKHYKQAVFDDKSLTVMLAGKLLDGSLAATAYHEHLVRSSNLAEGDGINRI